MQHDLSLKPQNIIHTKNIPRLTLSDDQFDLQNVQFLISSSYQRVNANVKFFACSIYDRICSTTTVTVRYESKKEDERNERSQILFVTGP